MFITYGARANSFLLVEYGFAIRNNKYDFNRVKNVTVKNFFPKADSQVEDAVTKVLKEKFNMKSVL